MLLLFLREFLELLSDNGSIVVTRHPQMSFNVNLRRERSLQMKTIGFQMALVLANITGSDVTTECHSRLPVKADQSDIRPYGIHDIRNRAGKVNYKCKSVCGTTMVLLLLNHQDCPYIYSQGPIMHCPVGQCWNDLESTLETLKRHIYWSSFKRYPTRIRRFSRYHDKHLDNRQDKVKFSARMRLFKGWGLKTQNGIPVYKNWGRTPPLPSRAWKPEHLLPFKTSCPNLMYNTEKVQYITHLWYKRLFV